MSAVVYVWPGADGLPSASPFCLKVLYAAKFKGIALERKATVAPPKGHRQGYLPVLVANGRSVPDSTNILKTFDEMAPDAPPLYPRDSKARAETLLLDDWADESLYWYLLYFRWAVDHNFEKFAAQVFRKVPAPLRPLVKRVAQGQAKGPVTKHHPIGTVPDAEKVRNFTDALWSLEQKLFGSAFLTGAAPTAADFAVYPILHVIEKAGIVELAPILSQNPALTAWMGRMSQFSAVAR